MTTPDPAIDALAYALYVSFQRGAGIFAQDEPYPVKAWHDLPDHYRERYLHRADRLHTNPGYGLTLAHRLYLAWWPDRYVKPFDRISDGLRALWWRVGEEYAALTAERRAAA